MCFPIRGPLDAGFGVSKVGICRADELRLQLEELEQLGYILSRGESAYHHRQGKHMKPAHASYLAIGLLQRIALRCILSVPGSCGARIEELLLEHDDGLSALILRE